jgi:hypothetical protein
VGNLRPDLSVRSHRRVLLLGARSTSNLRFGALPTQGELRGCARCLSASRPQPHALPHSGRTRLRADAFEGGYVFSIRPAPRRGDDDAGEVKCESGQEHPPDCSPRSGRLRAHRHSRGRRAPLLFQPRSPLARGLQRSALRLASSRSRREIRSNVSSIGLLSIASAKHKSQIHALRNFPGLWSRPINSVRMVGSNVEGGTA